MDLELSIVVILLVVVVLLVGAQLSRVPYPILLVVGGLGLGLVPAFPDVELDPELVLVVLLPPLLYSASFFTPLRELRRNVRPISLLAVGLVLTTAVTVAAAAHWVVGIDWAGAFVLGAVVAPTDPVAATAIANRLGVPKRIVHDPRGREPDQRRHSLGRVPVRRRGRRNRGLQPVRRGRRVRGQRARWDRRSGSSVGAVIAAVRRRLDNPPVEVTIALFSAYFAYLPAEMLGVSGVLAAVTVGIYMGRLTSVLTNATTRLQGDAVWEIVTFLLNSALFRARRPAAPGRPRRSQRRRPDRAVLG